MSFYKMERGWMDSPMFGDAPYTEREAWSWLVGAAVYEDSEFPINGKRIKLKRGQLSHSLRFMAEKFKWSKNKVQRFLDKLEEWDSIIVKNGTENGTGQNIITICNYNKYQDKREKRGTESGTAKHEKAGQDRDKEKEYIINTADDNARANGKVHVEVGKKISQITGWDKDPNWFGDYSRIEAWLQRGWIPDRDIYPTIQRIMRKRDGPPRSLKYFEQAIADAHKANTAPLPKGKTEHGTDSQKLTKRERMEAAADAAIESILASQENEAGSGPVQIPDYSKL